MNRFAKAGGDAIAPLQHYRYHALAGIGGFGTATRLIVGLERAVRLVQWARVLVDYWLSLFRF